MDLNLLGLHIHELRNQCRYIEANIGIFSQMLEHRSSVGVFFTLQGIMVGSSNISRLVWSPRKKGKDRSAALRDMLGLPEKHPLNNSNIIGLLEQSDEMNDAWISQSKNEYILYDFIGEIASSQHKDAETKNIFRAYDPTNHTYYYRGQAYNLDAMLKALGDLADRVNQVHIKLFPEQWKETDENGNPINASDKQDSEAAKTAEKKLETTKKEPKKAAPKKKPAAKKKPATKKEKK